MLQLLFGGHKTVACLYIHIWEVEHPKKKLVRKRTRFFIGCSISLGL